MKLRRDSGLLYAAIVELIAEKFRELEAEMVIILASDIYSTVHSCS